MSDKFLISMQENVSFEMDFDLHYMGQKINISGINQYRKKESIFQCLLSYCNQECNLVAECNIKEIRRTSSLNCHQITINLESSTDTIVHVKNRFMEIIDDFNEIMDNWNFRGDILIPIPGEKSIKDYEQEVFKYISYNMQHAILRKKIINIEQENVQSARHKI